MYSKIKFLLIFLFIFSFNNSLLKAESSSQNMIYMVSLGSDSVGKGGSYVLNDDEGLFFVNYLPTEEGLYRGDGFSIHFNGGVANSWTFDFAAPYQQKMCGNREFVGAQAFPGQSPRKPGIRITRSGENVTNISGSFNVIEFEKNENGEILALAVDFRQVNNGAGVLVGSIRYNSSVPINADLYNLNDSLPLEMFMESYHGDWVGLGNKCHYKQKAIPFFTSNGSLNLVIEGWDMSFSTPDGRPFEKGTYLHAKRDAFRDGHAGIDIGGHGRGCNNIDGSFEILEIEYDSFGRIIVLALDFKQCCDGRGLLKGSVRYNSSIPINVDNQLGKLEIRMQGHGGWVTGDKEYAKSESIPSLLPIRDFGQNAVLYFDVEGFTLTFVPPQNQPFFTVGKYLNANRFPFQPANTPGMDVSGNGCGCNSVEGDFEILEIEYNDDGAIIVLALDFVHHCEGRGSVPTLGTIRYNSNIPHVNQFAGLYEDESCL